MTPSASLTLPRSLYGTSLEQRRADAAERMAPYSQYNGYFAAWILVYVVKDVVCKGGTLPVGYTIAAPIPQVHYGIDMPTYSTWDAERGHVVAAPADHVMVVSQGDRY